MTTHNFKDGDLVQAYNRGLWLDCVIVRVAPNGAMAELRSAKGKARFHEATTRIVPSGTFGNGKKRLAKEEALRQVEQYHAKNRLAAAPKLAADVGRVSRTSDGVVAPSAKSAKEQITAAGKALTAMRSAAAAHLGQGALMVTKTPKPAAEKTPSEGARGISAFTEFAKVKGEDTVEYRCKRCSHKVAASTTDGQNALGRDARLKAAIRKHFIEKHAAGSR